MPTPPEIRDLQNFLKLHLNENEEIVSHMTSYLTKPGENYGSTMLSLELTTRNTTTLDERKRQLIAKMCPQNEEVFRIFQTDVSFIKENMTYTTVIPELKKLQIEHGIPENEVTDIFPECYGARASLDPNSNIVDNNALLILGNLKLEGYFMGNCKQGFDVNTTKIVLKSLAQFHALPLALRLHKPDIFAKKVMPSLKRINMNETTGEDAIIAVVKVTMNLLSTVKELEPYLNRIRMALEDDMVYQRNPESPNDTFATIVHGDFWVNNILIKNDSNNSPAKSKILDFQITVYDSLIHDLIFFLCTSVNNETLDQNFDKFIEYYHQQFCDILIQTGCKLNEDYNFENFKKEFNALAVRQFYHILSMLRILYQSSKSVVHLEEYDASKFVDPNFVGPEYVTKAVPIIFLFIRNNWI